MGRAPCCDKANVKKGPWSAEEDAKLKDYIEQHGTGGNWIALPQKIGLKRCGKSCRLRWLNYLRPNIRHGGFSEEEDNIICSLYISIGSRWSIIAAQLPGRTDNDIKNYWNTRLKKKIFGKPRRDAVYHPSGSRRGSGGGSGGPKQEPKKAEVETFMVPPGITCSQTPYWSEPPPPPLSAFSGQQDINAFHHHEQASIRRLLMKLGGRFGADVNTSSTAGIISPLQLGAAAPHQPPIFDNNSNVGLLPSSSPMPNCLFGGAADVLDGLNPCFPIEFDEMLFGNSMKLEGLVDGFYGAGASTIVDGCGSSSGTSSSESVGWSNVSPLVYPPQLADYQQCAFDEQMHLGGSQ